MGTHTKYSKSLNKYWGVQALKQVLVTYILCVQDLDTLILPVCNPLFQHKWCCINMCKLYRLGKRIAQAHWKKQDATKWTQ